MFRVKSVDAGGVIDVCERCVRSPRFQALVKTISQRSMFVLLDRRTSRPNKLALAADHIGRGFFLEWRWQGEPMRSRLTFRFSPMDRFFEAKSYEEDVAPFLQRMEGRTSK